VEVRSTFWENIALVNHRAGLDILKAKVQHRKGLEGPGRDKGYSCTLSLTSALDGMGGQRHAPAALTPGKRPGAHCIEGWVGPRAGLDGCGKSRPHQDSIPRLSSL